MYEISFKDSDKLYVGCTCEELSKRLEQHLKDPESQVCKNKKDKPVIKLIITFQG